MRGSVWEWYSDWIGDYLDGSTMDTVGASSGSYCVLRGGSWNNYAGYYRSASQRRNDLSVRFRDIGVRLSLVRVEKPQQPECNGVQ